MIKEEEVRKVVECCAVDKVARPDVFTLDQR